MSLHEEIKELKKRIDSLESVIDGQTSIMTRLSTELNELREFVGVQDEKNNDSLINKIHSMVGPKFDFWTIRSGGSTWFQGFIKGKPRWTKYTKSAKKYKTQQKAMEIIIHEGQDVDIDSVVVNGYGNEVRQ